MSISELFILEHVFLAHMKKIAAEFWPIQRSEEKKSTWLGCSRWCAPLLVD